MKNIIRTYTEAVKSLKDFPPLCFRLILAYGFYEPAISKITNLEATTTFFADIGIPFPAINASLAAFTEISGVLLLTIGLATRLISLPLMFVMLVAIKTVHWDNGFACSDNGYEIPFYYLFMLFSLIITGAGRFSLDHLISKKTNC